MVTVLIPTASRPLFLREALRSVAQQTAVKSIDQIFVSENGMDPSSEAICAEFPQLPIQYIFRNPAVTPLQHARIMMKEFLVGDITCILHDDDWWLPNHLANALSALNENPDASTYGSNFHISADGDIGGYNDIHAWFASNYAAMSPYWKMMRSNLLIGSLLGLVIHYSTMVIRTPALKGSAYIYDEDNPFDNDRMLLGALSAFGPVLFGTEVSAIVSHHVKRDTSSFSRQEQARRMSTTTEWLVKSSNKTWQTVATIFLKRLTDCPSPGLKAELFQMANDRPWCWPKIVQYIDNKELLLQFDHHRDVGSTLSRQQPA